MSDYQVGKIEHLSDQPEPSTTALRYSTPTELFQEIATLRASLAEAKQEARCWKLRVDEAAEVVGRLEQERDTAIADAKRMRDAIQFAIEPLRSAIRMLDEEGFNSDSLKGKIAALDKLKAALSAPTEKPGKGKDG